MKRRPKENLPGSRSIAKTVPSLAKTGSTAIATKAEKPSRAQREGQLILAAAQRIRGSPHPIEAEFRENDDGGLRLGNRRLNDVAFQIRLHGILATTSGDYVSVATGRLETMTRERGEDRKVGKAPQLSAALALIEAIAPQDELETSLAMQMAGADALATEMLWRARHSEVITKTEVYAGIATKLLRTFLAQIEALSRLRGKGQQTVRVEHVTVQPGAQAIVGDVHHHPQEGGGKSQLENRPHGTGPAPAGAALPSPDPTKDDMPLPSDAERSLQDTRRLIPGAPDRKPERPKARRLQPGNGDD